MSKKITIILSVVVLIFIGCKEEELPKPTAHLRLDFPEADYAYFDDGCPFSFVYNEESLLKVKNTCDISIQYPKMKATMFITYKPITENLNTLLRDAQKLTYEHVIKADDIVEQPFVNPEHKVYGMFYQVGGNAATNAQFYATDSTRHFITGSLYFYAKPNFDSIMPAASYIKDDMQTLLESLRWKE